MQFQILKNLEHLASGIIHLDKLPEALRLVSVGSRAFARAVMAFQGAYGLLVDGVCGPVTMAKILEEEEKAAKPKKKEKKSSKKGTAELQEKPAPDSVDGGEER